MTEYEAYQEHIRYTHDTYCRIVIRHASFDAARILAARWNEVKSSFVNFFQKGKTYIFSYSVDGDYLTIQSEPSFSYNFIRFTKESNNEIANLIYPINPIRNPQAKPVER